MDVVRNNLERIGGSVEVRSHPGHGTKFTIRVPLTLTIVPALIVGLGGRAYAIGQSSICEIVRLKDASLVTEVGGRPMLIDRKSVVSGKSVSVRVDLGGRRIIKKKTNRSISKQNRMCDNGIINSMRREDRERGKN